MRPLAGGFLGGLGRWQALVREEIAATPGQRAGREAGRLAWALLDRLLFLRFVQKKGLLDADPDYLYRHFLEGHAGRPADASFYRDLLQPLFLATSDGGGDRALAEAIGAVPSLAGAFVAQPSLPPDLAVSNATFQALFDGVFEGYDWTLDDEAAAGTAGTVGPGMLGQGFARLEWAQVPGPAGGRRRATGSYYTSRPVAGFLVREALAEYLAGETGLDRPTISGLLDLPAPAGTDEAERAWLSAVLAPEEARLLRQALLAMRACDPAAGSGAFVLELLRTMARAVGHLDRRLGGDAALSRPGYPYDLKKHLIERCLYGVDLQARAVQICRQRLWLALLADYRLPPDLPFARAVRQVPPPAALACQVWQGDSLLERPGEGGLGAGRGAFAHWADLAPVGEKGGFDLMVVNPPYGVGVPKEDWQRIKARYPGAGRARNLAAAFLALAFDCLHEGGVACQIVPKSVSYSRGWRDSRALLWDRGCLLASADASQAFEGVLLEQEVVLYRPGGGVEPRPQSWHLVGETFVRGHRLPLSVLKGQDAILNHLSAGAAGLLARLLERGRPLGDLARTARGQGCRSGPGPEDDARGGAVLIRGRDVRQFAVARELPGLDRREGREETLRAMPGSKIVSQNIVAHVTRPYDTLVIVSAVDRSGAAALDTVNVTLPLAGCPYPLEYLVALLNSSLARWYFYFGVYNRAVRTMHFDAPYVDGFPVAPASPGQVAHVCDLVGELEARQVARGAGREIKYFLSGDDPVYDALDEAVLALYAIEGDDAERVLRRKRERRPGAADRLHNTQRGSRPRVPGTSVPSR
ncbi:MAG: hypothetical protein P8129_13260 [Anaerolineae bacterium]